MILWGFLPWSASALAGRCHVVLSRGGLTNMWSGVGDGQQWAVLVVDNSGRGKLFAAKS